MRQISVITLNVETQKQFGSFTKKTYIVLLYRQELYWHYQEISKAVHRPINTAVLIVQSLYYRRQPVLDAQTILRVDTLKISTASRFLHPNPIHPIHL